MHRAHGWTGWATIVLACGLSPVGCSSSENGATGDSETQDASGGPAILVDGSLDTPHHGAGDVDSSLNDGGGNDARSDALETGLDSALFNPRDGGRMTGTDDGGLPDGAVHPAYPVLLPDPPTGQGQGVVLNDFKLVTIVASNDTNGSTWFAFGDALIQSQWWRTVSVPYGLGTIQSNQKLTGAPMTANPTYADLETYIAATLDAQDGGVPDGGGPDGETIYLLYLPNDVWVVDPTSGVDNTGCAVFGGFHSYASKNVDLVYGVVQQCPANQLGNETTVQETTHAASHEVVEAATDPFPTPYFFGYTIDCGTSSPPGCSPWAYAPGSGEVGDLCAWTATTEGAYVYTRAWSNAAVGSNDPCLPATSESVGYECAASTESWFAVAAGGSVSIPIHGWSSAGLAPSTEWYTFSYVGYAAPSLSSGIAFAVTTAPASSALSAGAEYLSTGSTFDLVITAPSGAKSGDFVVAIVASYTDNEVHPWAVGAYVP